MKLLYLEDFDVETCEAAAISFNMTEDDRVDVMLEGIN